MMPNSCKNIWLLVGRRWLLYSVTYSSFLRDVASGDRPTYSWSYSTVFSITEWTGVSHLSRLLSHENLLLVFSTRYTSFCCLNCVLGHVTCKMTGRGVLWPAIWTLALVHVCKCRSYLIVTNLEGTEKLNAMVTEEAKIKRSSNPVWLLELLSRGLKKPISQRSREYYD